MTSFGIHVGNTSCCLAVAKDGKTDVVASPTGDRTTPAVVAFQDTEIVVGLAAKQARIRNMNNTIVNNKNLVVGKLDDTWKEANPVSIIEKDGQIYYKVEFKDKDFFTTPSDILVKIYKYIHDIADSHSTDVSQCNSVVTVPLDYTLDQRNIIKTCATRAGFKVSQVISEPGAACLAYGLGQEGEDERYHCVVFRCGGVSTSVTLLLVAGGLYTVLASTDLDIGGDQVTDVLVQYLGAEFKQKYKEDILVNKRGKAKISRGAETVKHVLSTLDTAHCYVESLFDGMDFSSNVTRARFDNQVGKVLSDVLAPVSSLLASAGLTTLDIIKVVLAGGTSKVVKLQSALSSMFPSAEILSNYSPDEVIAMGAAVQASYISKDPSQNPTEKLLAVSQDIIAVVEGGEEVIVMVEDTTLPCKKSSKLNLPSSEAGSVFSVTLYWGKEKAAILTKLSLSSVSSCSKLVLSVHVHRDSLTHITLVDKTSGESVDTMLRMGG